MKPANAFCIRKIPLGSFALDVSEGTILRAWLGARYNRASFPDEFDRRLTKEANKAYGKLLKIFKATSDDIIAVFFDVDGGKEVDRAGPDDTYSLAIYLLFSAETDPEKAKRTAAAAAESITKIFREHFLVQHKWQNIELVSCEVTAESEMSVRASRLFKRWHLDYISLREDQPVLP